MFNKKKCPQCKNKASSSNSYCPNCGYALKSNQEKQEEFGLIGNSSETEQENSLNNLFPEMGFAGGIINKMLMGAMKTIEKELGATQNPKKQMSNKNFKLMINGKEIDLGGIQAAPKEKISKKSPPKIALPKNQLKDFAKLPQKTPSVNIRRLSDVVIYEIELPGVRSLKDISINNIGNTLEIKATSKDKSYSKTIELGLPLVSYNLSKENLILEFENKN